MCFGGSPKTPEVSAPPPPAPTPTVMPTQVSEISAQETARKKRLNSLRFGLASTIKTSPLGITGSSADLSAPSQGKQRLGS